jgi:hypothetical protein
MFFFYTKIPVNHSSDGALSNYLMRVVINKGSGTSNAGTVYLNNHSFNWPYDVKFTNAIGAVLDYWRESYDENTLVVWVKCDSIAASGNTDFYIYYGDHSAPDTSSGENTFTLFFDDFEDGTLDKWSFYLATISSDISKGDYSAMVGDNPSPSVVWMERTFDSSGIGRLRMSVYHVSNGASAGCVFSLNTGTTLVFYFAVDPAQRLRYYNGSSWMDFSNVGVLPFNEWHEIFIEYDVSGNAAKVYLDDEYLGVATRWNASSTINKIRISSGSGGTATTDLYVDDIGIFSDTANAPTWSYPGPECSNDNILTHPCKYGTLDSLSFLQQLNL